MRLLPILLGLCANALAATPPSSSTDSTTDSVTISLQPITNPPSPILPLASISYNPSTLTSSLTSFEAPEIPPSTSLLRIGVVSPSPPTSWKSSVSVTSAESFTKGYAPTFVVTLDLEGAVIGVSVKSAKIDAGQTRDFGPKVQIVRTKRGKGPVLNKPVVLSKEGKIETPEPEKTLLQKYWWVGLAAVMLLATSGGE